jgi:hypothetical protein
VDIKGNQERTKQMEPILTAEVKIFFFKSEDEKKMLLIKKIMGIQGLYIRQKKFGVAVIIYY